MKPNPIFVATAGFAMLGACTVKTEDNASANADANATSAAEGAAPADNTAGTDTLGNQLNQLQESGSSEENSTANAVE
jgi:hypothetical protein